MVPSGEGRLKRLFEAILLHGGFAAVQENTFTIISKPLHNLFTIFC